MKTPTLYTYIKKFIGKIARPKYCKENFLKVINHDGALLDVGCGNNSPNSLKSAYPNIFYTGIDVCDYNQTKTNLADKYIVVEPEGFDQAIAKMNEKFDTVLSSHNLEHCNNREKTLDAMIKALKPNGFMYLSFPSEGSINFPGPRKGCLNYYDDPTHKDTPPDFKKIMKALKQNNMEILFASKSYKPIFMYIIGFLLEWKSKKDKERKIGTWAFWGFEAIIWARRMS